MQQMQPMHHLSHDHRHLRLHRQPPSQPPSQLRSPPPPSTPQCPSQPPSKPRSPPPPSTPPTSIAASPCSQLRSPPPPSTPQRWRRVRRWRRQLGGGDRGCDGGGCAGLHNRFCHFLGPFSAPYLFVLLDWAIAFCYEEFKFRGHVKWRLENPSAPEAASDQYTHTHTLPAMGFCLNEAEPVQ